MLAAFGLDADIYSVRKELVGELNSRVIKRLNKVLTVHSTVSASTPTVGFPVEPKRCGLRAWVRYGS
eukprot:5691966-Pyramimonas_sp.AAC.1